MAAMTAPLITRPEEPRTGLRIVTTGFQLGGISSTRPEASGIPAGLDATLIAVDEKDHTVAALPVVFRQRVVGEESVRLFGVDPSGALRVSSTLMLKPPSLQLNLRYEAGGPALPRQLLPAFRFLRALRQPARMGLIVDGRSAGEPDELPSDKEFPSGLLEVTRSLAFVQALAGAEFPMPPEFDEEDLRELQEAEALLAGGTVSGRWNDAKLTAADTDWLDAIKGADQLMVEFVGQVVARIAGHDIPLGEANYVFRTAIVEGVLGSEVQLRPGTDDRFEVTLLEPPDVGLDLQDIRPPVVASVDALAAARSRPLAPDAFRSVS